MMADDGEQRQQHNTPTIELSYPVNVIYCGECSMPIEYCEYSGKFDKCQQWLERNLPELAEKQMRIDGGGALTGTTAAGETGTDGGGGEDTTKKHQKRGGKGMPKSGGKGAGKTVTPHITLKTEVRSKNKAVTVVKGLTTCGIDLKAASKFFSNRFACGCSVVSGATDELVIQGDFKDKLFDVIPEKWEVDEDAIEDLGGVGGGGGDPKK